MERSRDGFQLPANCTGGFHLSCLTSFPYPALQKSPLGLQNPLGLVLSPWFGEEGEGIDKQQYFLL